MTSSDSFRSIWLTIAAITCVLLIASYFGTPIPGTNEPHYLAKARATADPDWCVNDFFLQSENAHAVFFAIVGPFAKVFPFAVVLAAGRIVSLLIVAIGLHSLCTAVGCNARRSLIAAALFFLIGLTGNFSGEWVIGGFESKVPAYGFTFLSLAVCIRSRSKPTIQSYVYAGIYTGFAVALHPVVGAWTAIAISMTEVWLWLRPSPSDSEDAAGFTSLLRRGTTYGLTSLLCALPGLIPAFQMLLASQTDLATKQAAKQIQVFYRLAHHLDPTRFPAFSWWHTAVLLAALTITIVWIRRQRGDSQDDLKLDLSDANGRLKDSEAYLIKFLVCTGIIAAAGIAIGWHEQPIEKLDSRHWRAALLQFYPFRLFDAFLPLSTAIFLSAIPEMCRTENGVDGKTLKQTPATAYQGAMFPSVAVTAGIMMILCGAAAIAQRPLSPSGYNSAVFADWKQACAWLKDNTPEDSLIFTPRESFAFKLYAERAEYVAFKDCPQDADGIVEWNRRLWKMHQWSQQSYRDKVFDKSELLKLKQQMGIDYVLTRRLGPFSEPPVWAGRSWRIYPTVVRNAEAAKLPDTENDLQTKEEQDD